ncbi:MAG: SAM-dependent methyltransferase [Chloroflexi bacterium]|nr:SAM-dependent methyltransferase [Chloroflexota bacterium]
MIIAPEAVLPLLDRAIEARLDLLDGRHETAVRLFNGFLEGCPQLVVDIFGKTAVFYNYASPPEDGMEIVSAAGQLLQEKFSWLQTILVKMRKGSAGEKRGKVVWEAASSDSVPAVCNRIREHDVRYALELQMNQDASFYMDTRNLRRWALDNLSGKEVLNTFAYTSSLGVAAEAGGANRVVHTDLNKQFLNVAKTSYTLNGFSIDKKLFRTGDFWPQMNRFKRAGERFDCVFVDPPFFSTTAGGRVDLNRNMTRILNKIRPLVKHGGHIVAINNALFVSGQAYLAELQALCADGYVEIEQFIPVPADCAGYPHTRSRIPVTDPSPFNHATKIVILKIRHNLVNNQ